MDDLEMVRRKITSFFIQLAIGVAIGLAASQIGVSQMRPTHYAEYNQLKNELYDYYNSSGTLPEVADLSIGSKEIINSPNRITYTKEAGLSFMYDKSYPSNIPFVGIVTMGLYWGGTETMDGEGLKPEHIISNAQLRSK